MGLWSILGAYLMAVSLALPSSLVDEIKSSEMRNNKVKRAHPDHAGSNENVDPVNYFNKHTSAIKRGTNLKTTDPELSSLPEWDADQFYSNSDFNMDSLQSGLFNSPNMPLDDKTIAEYEKGYRYGTNKDKLDEALENAVLKNEAYREPYSQFRFYGSNDRRRRRDTNKQMRPKRNVDLTPEEVLALLTLYENNRSGLKENDNYRQPIFKYGKGYGVGDIEDFDTDNNDETWLNAPVFPHASVENDVSDNYLYDYVNGAEPDYKARWGGFGDAKKKRFIIAKKRTSDPTRMIRYINGPNQNDFDTLSNLMNNQKEPRLDVPIYHRKVL
uniref:NVP-like protein n=1 Tax=Rhynchophorus ferrugineus TaxID=354439 RepID=A0A5Q0TX52_RHYFE|nr:NVP-like protein [Rhynchophorus ferrugineus]